jgi:phenylacetate-CoA ligase
MAEKLKKDFIKNIGKSVISPVPIEFRLGLEYRKRKSLLKKAENWNDDKISAWQYSKLQKLLHLAYYSTSGYYDLYSSHGVHPRDFRSIDDLKYFPLVNKEILSSNIESFTIQKRKKAYKQRTSGTTGIPFTFWQTCGDFTESAFIHDTWKKFGHDPNELAGVLKGGFGSHEDKIISFSGYERSLFLSTPMLSATTIPSYLEQLKNKNIKNLRALPSSFNLFCELLDNIDKELWPSFDVVSLSSEMITNANWEKFSSYFPNTVFFSWYGHSEHAVFAAQCMKSKVYHPNGLYGYTEVLSEDLMPQKKGLNGAIVGTSFWSSPTLFIRYMTDDVAEVGDDKCQFCGSSGMIWNQIIGRSSDYFVGNDRSKISATIMNLQDETYDGIAEYQFSQNIPGKVSFNFVERLDSKGIDTNLIQRKMEAKFGHSFYIEINKVKSIPRPKSGKLKWIKQDL